MKIVIYTLLFAISFSSEAKEWKNLKAYQKVSLNEKLPPSDWLKSDRKQNTLVWQNANTYNLTNNKPEEYKTIIQRRDFYTWFNAQIKAKGHEVVWPKMAYFISHKLRLIESFPHNIFTSKALKGYANKGSETVFNNAFSLLEQLWASQTILKGDAALQWDESILKKEQYIWIEDIYKTMDKSTVKKIERMAKGKFLYGLVVPNAIRFEGDISKAEDRFQYAMNTLRVYCKDL